MKKKYLICVLVFCSTGFFASSILSDASFQTVDKLSSEGQNIINKGTGAVSDAVFFRIATQLSTADFVAAFYGESRSQRRIALDAAGYLENPWPIIPYLIAFLEAPERQTASAAANSLRNGLQRAFDMREKAQLPVDGQAKYTCELLRAVSKNGTLDADLRVMAVQVTGLIHDTAGAECSMPDELFFDQSLAVRQAALSSVGFPLNDGTLALIAKIALDDSEPILRGTAVSMVCENALSHQIGTPSKDLADLVGQLFDAHREEQVIAPVLGCLARFPYRARASLTDKIMNCGNEKVIKYWKSLI